MGAGATLARRLLAAPARFVFLRFSCPERNANPKSRAVRYSLKNRLRARVARRQPIFVLALDAGLFRLQAKRPARTPSTHDAPRSGLHPKYGAGATLARRLLAAPARFVFLRFSCPERSANPKSRAVRHSMKNRLRLRYIVQHRARPHSQSNGNPDQHFNGWVALPAFKH